MSSLYSHPGKYLKDHLNNVYRIGLKKYMSKELNFENKDKVKTLLEIVLICHDFGKANKYFQRKLKLKEQGREDEKEYKELAQQGLNKSNHSLLSAIITYYIADEVFNKDQIYSLLSMVIVLKHHGNLKDFVDMLSVSNWDLLEEQFVTLDFNELQSILELSTIKVNIKDLSMHDIKDKLTGRDFRRKKMKLKRQLNKEENYLLINFLYSLLISSDKADAIFYSKGMDIIQLENMVFERRNLPVNSVDIYRQSKGWNNADKIIDKQRNQIYGDVIDSIKNIDLVKNRILSINVPTGTGKTLTSLSAGLKMREILGQKYRIIYALPFTSVIDQNYSIYEEVFKQAGEVIDSKLLIKHHYLTPKTYIKKDTIGEEIYDNDEYDISKHLIESWNSEVVVTTFVQLLHSLFTNKNKDLIKFNNIANSIILLDEVQSIPYKYWKLVRNIFNEIADKLNCYFIFITATMPLIYNERNNEIRELATRKKAYFEFFDRIVLDLSRLKNKMNLVEFKEFLANEVKKYSDKNMLIILNTIKSSIEIYDYIKEIINMDEEEVIYLSTNIVPCEREKRIKKIGKNDKRQIIVSTQMVEAGVDIDLDRVYRDFAPLDSINQTCGRCNRNFDTNKKGTVILFRLVNENHNNKLFASYVYGDILMVKTLKILLYLSDKVFEKEFYDVNNRYFELINKAKADDESDNLLSCIKQLKYEKAFSYNDENTVFQIIGQDYDTVNLFIELDETAVSVWQEYQEINKIEIQDFKDFNKRRSLFEKIKKDFLNYVITVPKYVAKKHFSENQLNNKFNYVNYYQVEDVYNIDTGFKRGKVELQSFF
ncbi:MAG: CRISPR-associated helicase Cas3' [bacterium]